MTDFRQKYERRRESLENAASELIDPNDTGRILEMLDAYDSEKFNYSPPDGQKEKEPSTLYTYTGRLEAIAGELSLTEATTDDFNNLFQQMYDGDTEVVKSGGISKGSIRSYQNALRQFLWYNDEAEADPESITLVKSETSTVDPEEMLTREEIHAIRAEAGCMRDLALFDFLIYTGQRNTAARTLRIKDLDLEKGRFKLNSDATGLKDADNNGKWRDLLMSAATLRQYLNTEHPDPDTPDNYVFTGRPKWSKADPKTPINHKTVSRNIQNMAKAAAESHPAIADKPTHPHALRHNFVTIALRRGMKEHVIKHQIGHSIDSSVMESTYAHLKDDDHIQAAREAFDLPTESEESTLAPEACPQCGTAQPEKAVLCGVCGLEFSPDAKDVAKKAEEAIHDSKGEAAANDDEKAEAGVDVTKELLDNPDAKAAIMEEMKDELMAELREELGQ